MEIQNNLLHYTTPEITPVDRLGFQNVLSKKEYDDFDKNADPTKCTPYYPTGIKIVKEELKLDKRRISKEYNEITDQFAEKYVEINSKTEEQWFINKIISPFIHVCPIVIHKEYKYHLEHFFNEKKFLDQIINILPIAFQKKIMRKRYFSKIINVDNIKEEKNEDQITMDLLLLDLLFGDCDHIFKKNMVHTENKYALYDFNAGDWSEFRYQDTTENKRIITKHLSETSDKKESLQYIINTFNQIKDFYCSSEGKDFFINLFNQTNLINKILRILWEMENIPKHQLLEKIYTQFIAYLHKILSTLENFEKNTIQ